MCFRVWPTSVVMRSSPHPTSSIRCSTYCRRTSGATRTPPFLTLAVNRAFSYARLPGGYLLGWRNTFQTDRRASTTSSPGSSSALPLPKSRRCSPAARSIARKRLTAHTRWWKALPMNRETSASGALSIPGKTGAVSGAVPARANTTAARNWKATPTNLFTPINRRRFLICNSMLLSAIRRIS